MSRVALDSIWLPESQQLGFRRLLTAMSYPGRIVPLPRALVEGGSYLGVLACLVDASVTFADPNDLLTTRERSLLGAECVPDELADYVLHDAALPPRPEYAPQRGTIYRPDSSATLILNGEFIGKGDLRMRLEGPGIEVSANLCLTGFHAEWFTARERWVSNFPTGVDVILCDRESIAALPRTCRSTL